MLYTVIDVNDNNRIITLIPSETAAEEEEDENPGLDILEIGPVEKGMYMLIKSKYEASGNSEEYEVKVKLSEDGSSVIEVYVNDSIVHV